LLGNGASTSASGNASNSIAYVLNTSGTTTSNIFVANIVDILDYTNTNKYKTLRSLSGGDYNGSGAIALTSSVWLNTAAITTITISTGGYGDLLQYSSFALYGIK
jgi:hypothetical protein